MRSDKDKVRTPWTEEQHHYVENLVRDALSSNARSIDWRPHLPAIGHSYNATIARACDIRQAIRDQEARNALRVVAEENAERQRINNNTDSIEGHRTSTSTGPMAFATEMRRRITAQGITAGLLGDPLPGRSALDRKRAGVVDVNLREIRERQYAETSAQMWRLRWKRERGELPAK